MLSQQCNDFVFLSIDTEMREALVSGVRTALRQCAQGELDSLVLGQPQTVEDWSTINNAIEWLLPRVDAVLSEAGLPETDRCQLRQALFATSSTKSITAQAVCRVLRVELEDFAC